VPRCCQSTHHPPETAWRLPFRFVAGGRLFFVRSFYIYENPRKNSIIVVCQGKRSSLVTTSASVTKSEQPQSKMRCARIKQVRVPGYSKTAMRFRRYFRQVRVRMVFEDRD
jgi:hypothetical protein